ncbi:venom carboxylesterase-6-like [Homalodisca vitripennis]|uniref:venom carboxylesterase-6-like n=1 Tax=Homalodisca vitripennis TaxID=197043 RepID=UPI001EE9EB33|nr:venom carboxylesterase-6-like [Homalodisca vitripennis]
MAFCATLLITFLTFSTVRATAPEVTVEHGRLRGRTLTTAGGKTIYSFEGIPYAEAPVGALRFQEPEPLRKPWQGVWDASHPGSVCLQYDHMTYLKEEPILGDEDCLYINVYTTELPNSSKTTDLKDVIVYIHGGAFTYGGGHLYMPWYLLDHDVVYASINYRLGPLGFLSTEDEVVPGNNGLKDQAMALAWLQRNVAAFGGNPSSVTITGMSAGGASVHYHYLSPRSVGLFHKGVSMSGSALCPWTQTEEAARKARDLASALGCPTKSNQELVDCLRTRPARRIVRLVQTPLFMPWHFNPYSPFGPVQEKAGSNPFLTQHPWDILQDGKVQSRPWLASVTSEEGLYPVSNFVANATLLAEIEKDWLKIAPALLDYNYTVVPDHKDEVSLKIKEYYMKGQPISRSTVAPFIQLASDRLFVVDVERAARLMAQAEKAPVYFYRFSYRGKHSYSEMMSWGSTENFGVSHGDDTGYMLGVEYMNPLETESDLRMSKLMVNMWVNFAKTGKPKFGDAAWTPVSPTTGLTGTLDFLHIASPDNAKPETSADLGHRTFWDTLPFNEPANLYAAHHHTEL